MLLTLLVRAVTQTAISFVCRYEEPLSGAAQHERLLQSQPHNPHRAHHVRTAGKSGAT